MSAVFARLELWTDLACNTGTPVAVVPVSDLQTTEEIINLLVTRRLTARVSMAWDDRAELAMFRVLRVVDTAGAFEEYRIHTLVDSSGGDRLVTITALGVEYDLARGTGLVYRVWNTGQDYAFTGQGTPTYLLGVILARAPSYFSAGTVTPTAAIALPFANDTPLAAALKVADLGNVAAGATYELSVRRNGVTGYYVDLTVYGASATGADLRSGKSLQGVQRTMTGSGMTTRVFPLGSDGGTVGDAWWKVTVVSLNSYIEIADIDGSAINPILADGQFDGGYVLHEDGVSHAITATNKANKRLSMASTTGIAVNEWCKLVQDASLTEWPYIDHPTNRTTYGVQIGSLAVDNPSHTNWFLNPDFAEGATSWTTTGTPAFVALYQYGGQAASLASGAFTTVDQTRTIYYTAGRTVTIVVWVYVLAYSTVAGAVYGDSGFAGIQFTNPQTGVTEDVNLQAGSCSLETWTPFSRTYQITTTGAKATTIRTKRGTSSGATIYLDAAMATVYTNSIQGVASSFVRYSGAASLWLNGVRHLLANSTPITTYEVSCLDLARVDPAGAGLYEALNLGATVTITDADLAIATTVRLVRIVTNCLVLHDTKVALSTAPLVLTRLLTA